MTKKELSNLLKTLNIPVAYDHFDKPQKPPCICYYTTGRNNIYADDKPYLKRTSYDIELACEKKSTELENAIENLFEENEIVYDSDEVYIESQNIYEVTYSIEIEEELT